MSMDDKEVALRLTEAKNDLRKQGYNFQETAKITLCSGIVVYLASNNYSGCAFYIFIVSLGLSFLASMLLICGKFNSLFKIILSLSSILFIIGLFFLTTFSKINNNHKKQNISLNTPTCKYTVPYSNKSYTIHGDINDNKCEIIVKPYAKNSQSKKDNKGKGEKPENGG